MLDTTAWRPSSVVQYPQRRKLNRTARECSRMDAFGELKLTRFGSDFEGNLSHEKHKSKVKRRVDCPLRSFVIN